MVDIGALIEIPTSRGQAYAQYTHEHARFGQLIRVLPGLFERRPDLTRLARERERFFTFYPLKAMLADGDICVVAHAPIPPASQPFPTFKSGGRDPTTGRVEVWWLWDGEREWRADAGSPEIASLPPRGIVNHAMLVQRIVDGWKPEDWGAPPRARQEGARGADAPKGDHEAGTPTEIPAAQFYLYFPDEGTATSAATELRMESFDVDLERSATGELPWLVRARLPSASRTDMEEIDAALERLAARLEGVYDGHEIAVRPS